MTAREAVPVEAVLGLGIEEVGQVDGAEVAGLVIVEGLLAAGVRGPDGAEAGGGVAGVDPVDEDEAGVADGPGRLDDELEDLAGVLAADGAAEVGVDEVVLGAGGEGGHEGVRDGDGDVEVRDGGAVELHLDELLDVGVVDAEDAHVGAAAGAALLDGLGRGVDDLEEGDRAGGDALGLADEAALGPEAAEVEAGAARPPCGRARRS